MKCTLCGKEVVLIPSAAERARSDVTGETAAYYTSLFPRHAACELKKRKEDTSELIRRIRNEQVRTLVPTASS